MNLSLSFKENPNVVYWSIASIFGFLGFILEPTAYTWGEQDMMPFYERFFDVDYLKNDFFTNSVAQKNPRWVFGYIIAGISWLTGIPWYKTLYIFKLLIAILNPILYYQVLLLLVQKFTPRSNSMRAAPFILTTVVLMIFVEEFRHYFSVGSWTSYNTGISAFNSSISLGLGAVLLKNYGVRPIYYLLIFFISCLIHPVMGFFTIIFYIIFLLPEFKKEFKNVVMIVLTGGIAVLSIKMVFASDVQLSALDFIEYYVIERHPWHYHVPDYTHRYGNWRYYFIFMNLLFLIPLGYALLKKKPKLALLAFISLTIYSFSIGFQYFFIDIYPVKIIAYLGISRFTTFGYWILVALWGIMLFDYESKEKKTAMAVFSMRHLAILILNFLCLGILFLDNPKETGYLNNKGFYDFVKETTEETIFLSYSTRLNTDIRIIGKRSVFIGKEFPFVESAIKEFNDRYVMVYGSKKEGISDLAFFRKLKMRDFVEIAEKFPLTYVVIETKFSQNFAGYEPTWKDGKNSIYRIKNTKN